MKQILYGTTSLAATLASARLGYSNGVPPERKQGIGSLLTDRYIEAIEKALPVGATLTAPKQAAFHNANWLLQVILPNSIKESVKTGVPEAECRAKILRVLEWDKVEFKNRLALKAFSNAGQKPTFDGLCNITDPDLFVSVLAFSLGYKPDARVYLGFRDTNKLPEKWLLKFKQSPERFQVIHGTYKPEE